MADVVVDTEITDPQELVKLATKADIIHDYNSAVSAYSKAIEIIVAEHGDKHDSLGDIYLAYGRTLLEISREESEPLGDAVAREYSSESETEEDNKENEEKEKVIENENENTETSQEGEVKDGDEKVAASKMDCEGKGDEEEKTDEKQNDEEKKCDDGEPTNGSNEDEPTDLQLAWEVLELAKLIFEERGAAGRRGLSETLVLLGDVSLESENFENAIVDIKAGLEIQKSIFKPDNRTLAETYYKLGVALSTNNQIDESIENYNASLEVLNMRLAKLKEDEANQKDEIKDIENLIPDINEKIADMKSYKEEATTKLVAAMVVSKPTTQSSPFEAGSSDKKVCDISHLVKRKRKEDEVKEESEENPPKKLSV